MNHDRYDDQYIANILRATKTIALVGASPKPNRPSYGVMAFLLGHGYHVIPVNPQIAGTVILDQLCVAALADIKEPIDLVDVFRSVDAVPGIVDEAIAVGAKTIWLQLGIRDDASAAKAEAAGLSIVMDRCPAIEIPRLGL